MPLIIHGRLKHQIMLVPANKQLASLTNTRILMLFAKIVYKVAVHAKMELPVILVRLDCKIIHS